MRTHYSEVDAMMTPQPPRDEDDPGLRVSRRTMLRGAVAAALASGFTGSPAKLLGAQPAKVRPEWAEFDDAVRKSFQRLGMVGAAVAVVSADQGTVHSHPRCAGSGQRSADHDGYPLPGGVHHQVHVVVAGRHLRRRGPVRLGSTRDRTSGQSFARQRMSSPARCGCATCWAWIRGSLSPQRCRVSK